MRWIVLCMAVSALLALEPAAEDAASPECQPTYREFENGWIELNPAGEKSWKLSATVLLIGCKGSLESLSEDDMEKAKKIIEQAAQEAGFGLQDSRADEAFRRAICNKINAAVTHGSVSDVYFSGLSYSHMGKARR